MFEFGKSYSVDQLSEGFSKLSWYRNMIFPAATEKSRGGSVASGIELPFSTPSGGGGDHNGFFSQSSCWSPASSWAPSSLSFLSSQTFPPSAAGLADGNAVSADHQSVPPQPTTPNQMANNGSSSSAGISNSMLRRPFLFDDDTNVSLMSAAAFFVPKSFFGDLLLSQYLFKSGE